MVEHTRISDLHAHARLKWDLTTQKHPHDGKACQFQASIHSEPIQEWQCLLSSASAPSGVIPSHEHAGSECVCVRKDWGLSVALQSFRPRMPTSLAVLHDALTAIEACTLMGASQYSACPANVPVYHMCHQQGLADGQALSACRWNPCTQACDARGPDHDGLWEPTQLRGQSSPDDAVAPAQQPVQVRTACCQKAPQDLKQDPGRRPGSRLCRDLFRRNA